MQLQIRVLVVEDNEDHAETIRRVLANRTEAVYVVDAAYSLAEAITKLKGNGNFDVVLLDLGLPDSNGFDAIRKINAATCPDMAIVVYTGWGSQEDESSAKAAGADEFLTKPAAPAEVSKKLQFVVIRKRIAKERHAIERPLAEIGSIILRLGELVEHPEKAAESGSHETPTKGATP